MNNSGCIRFLLHLGFLMVLPAVSMGVPPPPSNSAIPSYKVVSLNIRYDGGSDDPQELRWEKRKGVVARALRSMDPDLIGLQEVLHNQLTDLRKIGALGLLYGSVGLNFPLYGRPLKVPLLATGTISSAHGTLDSAWLSFAPPAGVQVTPFGEFRW